MMCERCHTKSKSLTMSRFNTQMICHDCENAERAHPDYQNAVDVECNAVMNGDYNFGGIGLPAELR